VAAAPLVTGCAGARAAGAAGAVSFGIYAVATPIQFAQRGLLPGFAGSPLTFACVSLHGHRDARLAWLLELNFTWLKRRRVRPDARIFLANAADSILPADR